MVCNNSHPQQRQRMENERRTAKLLNPGVLDCPVCLEPLTIPIFQCDDGHVVCSFCLAKVSNKCPGLGCDLPIGTNRCFAMEKVLEAAFVPCRNVEFGCTNSTVSYGNVSSHEKECLSSLCICPMRACKYSGSDTNIYHHFIRSHNNPIKLFKFITGYSDVDVHININDKVLVLWEPTEKVMFVVQCFREGHGVYVSVRGISPSTPELGNFSYRLSYTVDEHYLTSDPELMRLPEVSPQFPEESSMFVPNSLLRGEMLEMKVGIKKLN